MSETTTPATEPVTNTSTESQPPAGTVSTETVPPAETNPPATTEYDLKLSENSPLAPETLEQIKSFAKEKNMTQEQAQALLQREEENLNSYSLKQKEFYENTRKAWVSQIKSDKEIGGENLKQNLELASRVVNKFATEELKKTLDMTGLGEHPELVRVFARIGKAMSNDQLVFGGSTSNAGKRELKDILYGSSNND